MRNHIPLLVASLFLSACGDAAPAESGEGASPVIGAPCANDAACGNAHQFCDFTHHCAQRGGLGDFDACASRYHDTSTPCEPGRICGRCCAGWGDDGVTGGCSGLTYACLTDDDYAASLTVCP